MPSVFKRFSRLCLFVFLAGAAEAMVRDPVGAGAWEGPKSSPGSMKVSPHQQVIPILLRRCTVCHGGRRREANLDLRTRAGMLQGGKSGPAIVPGDSAASLLIKKTRDGQMPPLSRIIEVSVKPIEPAEIDRLAEWIDAGAPDPLESDSNVSTSESAVTDEQRSFWSFRTPQQPQIPDFDAGGDPGSDARTRNPIDAFIAHRLRQTGRVLAPEADRPTLLRRATLDLTGLPPTPDEVLQFISDDRPDAYEQWIDRLLASPRYGERWARHWLDVAGYADSEGKTDQDLRRPFAWRYRDYVIQSFMADKPYDQFLTEQLAGDELADYENAEITREIYDNLVATGFLRMAPDGTFANITNFVPDRLEVIAEAIQVLGTGVMGMTLHCARCHDHKFDPIPQRDYYRLLDVFKGAYDEHDWLKPNRSAIASIGDWDHRLLPYVTKAERERWEVMDARHRSAIEALKSSLDSRAAPLRERIANERIAQLPSQIQDDIRSMLATKPEQRTDVQRYLADKFESQLVVSIEDLKKLDGDFRKASEEVEKGVKEIESQRVPQPMIHALWDRGSPSPTYLLRRGDFLNPAERVSPGVPSVLNTPTPFQVQPPRPGARSTGRRLAFARWITQPDHPLTARVIVNRIWKHHFGSGIVQSLDNFGTTGTPPTHPELLDWLAVEFVRQGWSIKAMHRLMMTSATYRQAPALSCDCNGALYCHRPLRRIDAEVLYDTLLQVSGRLDERRFGVPDAVDVDPDGLVTARASLGLWRRSIYVEQRRKQIPTLLENFDLPPMNPNCADRGESIVAPQALQLWNDGWLFELARQFAARASREAGPDPKDRVRWIFLTALSRTPSDRELELGVTSLAALTHRWSEYLQTNRDEAGDEPAIRALANFCHAMMNTAEFLYVD